jgi:hypothetical protein
VKEAGEKFKTHLPEGNKPEEVGSLSSATQQKMNSSGSQFSMQAKAKWKKCGRSHARNRCPAYNTRCKKCN